MANRDGKPVAKAVPRRTEVKRRSRGLLGKLDLADDWDAPAVNAELTRDFALDS